MLNVTEQTNDGELGRYPVNPLTASQASNASQAGQAGQAVKPGTSCLNGATRIVARSLFDRSPGFRACDPATLDQMVASGDLRRMGNGEWLARRGDPFDALGLVVHGAIENIRLRADGHRHLLNFLQPGDLVGIIGLIDGLGSVNDLRAVGSDCVVLIIAGATIRRFRAIDAGIGRAFELELALRSRFLYERLSADPSMTLDVRIARLLRSLARMYGEPCADGVRLKMKLSQADLGDWLGASRQRSNYAIGQLKSDGLITMRYSNITVTDPIRLAERAQL